MLTLSMCCLLGLGKFWEIVIADQIWAFPTHQSDKDDQFIRKKSLNR